MMWTARRMLLAGAPRGIIPAGTGLANTEGDFLFFAVHLAHAEQRLRRFGDAFGPGEFGNVHPARECDWRCLVVATAGLKPFNHESYKMKLLHLRAYRYRSLREETVTLSDLNLFIGTNASGKSTILDALRFLHEGVQERDFRSPVFSRGGLPSLGKHHP
jgi:hypothetical protein